MMTVVITTMKLLAMIMITNDIYKGSEGDDRNQKSKSLCDCGSGGGISNHGSSKRHESSHQSQHRRHSAHACHRSPYYCHPTPDITIAMVMMEDREMVVALPNQNGHYMVERKRLVLSGD